MAQSDLFHERRAKVIRSDDKSELIQFLRKTWVEYDERHLWR